MSKPREPAPMLKDLMLPSTDPQGFRRADWSLEEMGRYLFQIDEYVRGPSPLPSYLSQPPDVLKPPDLGQFRTIVLPMVQYESLVRRAWAFESVRAAFDKMCELTWRVEMNRLSALNEVEDIRAAREVKRG